MLELFAKGGWILFPIVGGSIIGVAVFFQRLWAIRPSQVHPPQLFRKLLELVRERRWGEARILCQQQKSSLSRIVLVALDQAEVARTATALKERVQEAGQREAFFLERGTGTLGIVASLEPLLGLLGTVLGMITAFQSVETGGVGDPRLVAGGVWKALLTTAAGLTVAIPMYIAYRLLMRLVDRRLLDLQSDVSLLVETIEHQRWGASHTEEPPQ
jgi:biopolymer transport protein ExbB